MQNYIYTGITAFILSFALCKILIPILKKLHAGQNILSYVKEHKNKGGTPTMGGLAFILSASIATLLFAPEKNRTLIVTLSIGLAYTCVGLLDDLLKCHRKENLGLKAWQKFAFQTCIALFVAYFCVKNGMTALYIPFTDIVLNIGYFTYPVVVFVFLATVNAVNLTDGLDGLASSVSIPYFSVFALLIALQGGKEELSIISIAISCSLAAYLLFNTSPASVFMGDTGSLALGGFAACIGCFSGNILYIAIIGICFVCSVISVLLQVIYYKATSGKRIFLMAPLHHHFQQKGYSETKISYAYGVVTAVIGVISLLSWI
jgi:phospho-N-acetylmuramoyl-pentapeptide-transferase